MGWINKITGELRPFIEGEDLPGYSLATHDLLEDIPEGYSNGELDWSAEDREFVPAAPPSLPVPLSVSPLQIRKALRTAGLKPLVDAFIATLDEEIVEEWEYATSVDRHHPLIATALDGLGWSSEQADDLFRLAASL